MNGGVRLDSALVVPAAAGCARLGILAGGEPLLCEVSEPEIVGCATSAHPRGHPSWVDGVAEDIGPPPAMVTASVVTKSLLSE